MKPCTCALDPIPTALLKSYIPILSPLIIWTVNLSFQTGSVPSALKIAVIHPLLKKPTLDTEVLAILSFLSKVLEKYTQFKKLAPSGSFGAQKTGRQQWIPTWLQFVEPHTKRKETTSNLTVRETSAAAADSDSPSNDTSSQTWASTSEEPCFFEAEPRPSTPLAESAICGVESTPTHVRG
eukprot:superscaffoldBa00000207_g2709